MKFAEPTEGQKLSFLLEKAASREAQLWRSYVPKKPANQVSRYSETLTYGTDLALHTLQKPNL